MALGQSMQQRQLQRLSPQQIQLMKLLQIPSAQIEQRIKEELEENPALEVDVALLESDFTSPEEMNDELLQDMHEDEEAVPVDEFEMSNEELIEYSYDDEVADYKTRDDFYPELDNDKVIPIKAEQSLHEVLMDQLSMLALDERSFKIAEQIIGSLDDDGYLHITGRVADSFKTSKGEYIEPLTLEQYFVNINEIEEVCVVGLGIAQPLCLIQLSEIGKKASKDALSKMLTETLDTVNNGLVNYKKI